MSYEGVPRSWFEEETHSPTVEEAIAAKTSKAWRQKTHKERMADQALDSRLRREEAYYHAPSAEEDSESRADKAASRELPDEFGVLDENSEDDRDYWERYKAEIRQWLRDKGFAKHEKRAGYEGRQDVRLVGEEFWSPHGKFHKRATGNKQEHGTKDQPPSRSDDSGLAKFLAKHQRRQEGRAAVAEGLAESRDGRPIADEEWLDQNTESAAAENYQDWREFRDAGEEEQVLDPITGDEVPRTTFAEEAARRFRRNEANRHAEEVWRLGRSVPDREAAYRRGGRGVRTLR